MKQGILDKMAYADHGGEGLITHQADAQKKMETLNAGKASDTHTQLEITLGLNHGEVPNLIGSLSTAGATKKDALRKILGMRGKFVELDLRIPQNPEYRKSLLSSLREAKLRIAEMPSYVKVYLGSLRDSRTSAQDNQ